MDIIYHYDELTGCLLGQGTADENPLDPASPLLPAYTTMTKPPATAYRECARYLTKAGHVPAHSADGEWAIHPDWRDIALWNKANGSEFSITEPNVTPDNVDATAMPYPGPGYVWCDNQWQADPALQYQLAEQAAERELASRQSVATAEINRIKPAVDGGYAKPEDIELLPKLQRYAYELQDVRTKPGWPDQPQWSVHPVTDI